MKCVKVVGPKKLALGEIEEPVSKNGSVVIKVNASGICGSDIHYWESGQIEGLVMGHEFAGVVVDPGNRDDLKVGDKVTGLPISPCGVCEACKSGNVQYCKKTWDEAVGLSLTNPGGYAEYTSCRSDLVKKLPENVSCEEGCMVEPAAVSLHAINLANIKIGDKVLVVGGGIIGLMAAEFAKLNGATQVTLMETNENRGKKALKYGKVDSFVNALSETAIADAVSLTNGGYDVVIECCGSSPAVTEAIMCAKPGGTVVLVGVSLTPITIPSVVPVLAEVNLQGAICYTEKEFEDVIELIEKKLINVNKYIDAKVQLGDAQNSFERLTSGSDDAIKIIFKP